MRILRRNAIESLKEAERLVRESETEVLAHYPLEGMDRNVVISKLQKAIRLFEAAGVSE